MRACARVDRAIDVPLQSDAPATRNATEMEIAASSPGVRPQGHA
jgi:hypothetical protein